MNFATQICYCTDNVKNIIWWEKSLAYNMYSVIIAVISVKYYRVCIRLVYVTELYWTPQKNPLVFCWSFDIWQLVNFFTWQNGLNPCNLKLWIVQRKIELNFVWKENYNWKGGCSQSQGFSPLSEAVNIYKNNQ